MLRLQLQNDSQKMMLYAIVSLIPAIGYKIYAFGYLACFSLFILVTTCILTEYAGAKLIGEQSNIKDLSSIVTAVLLFLLFNTNMPFFTYTIAAFSSIFIGKMIYGGLGKNIFNPAILGWCILMVSFPQYMTKHIPANINVKPQESFNIFFKSENIDTITQATPLGILKNKEYMSKNSDSLTEASKSVKLKEINIPKETITLNLLILSGGIFLVLTSVINLTSTIFMFLGVMFTLAFLAYNFSESLINFVLAGPFILGGFYMVTDPTTSPSLRTSQALYGFLIGFISILIAYNGAYPVGLAFAIIIMNSFVFLLDKLFKIKNERKTS